MSKSPAIRLALVAHDARKEDLVDWLAGYRDLLGDCTLYATGTTGQKIVDAYPDLSVMCLKSGPLGGDQQIGALIAEEAIDALIFFIDPLSALPHDVDVKALTRLAVVYDLPLACSRATADCVLGHLIGGSGGARPL